MQKQISWIHCISKRLQVSMTMGLSPLIIECDISPLTLRVWHVITTNILLNIIAINAFSLTFFALLCFHGFEHYFASIHVASSHLLIQCELFWPMNHSELLLQTRDYHSWTLLPYFKIQQILPTMRGMPWGLSEWRFSFYIPEACCLLRQVSKKQVK